MGKWDAPNCPPLERSPGFSNCGPAQASIHTRQHDGPDAVLIETPGRVYPVVEILAACDQAALNDGIARLMGRALTPSRTRPAARAKLPEIRAQTGRHGYAGLLHPVGLARVGGGVRQLSIGDRPNVLNAAAGAQKQSGRSQRYKRHEQGILDEVLPLFVLPEIT